MRGTKMSHQVDAQDSFSDAHHWKCLVENLFQMLTTKNVSLSRCAGQKCLTISKQMRRTLFQMLTTGNVLLRIFFRCSPLKMSHRVDVRDKNVSPSRCAGLFFRCSPLDYDLSNFLHFVTITIISHEQMGLKEKN